MQQRFQIDVSKFIFSLFICSVSEYHRILELFIWDLHICGKHTDENFKMCQSCFIMTFHVLTQFDGVLKWLKYEHIFFPHIVLSWALHLEWGPMLNQHSWDGPCWNYLLLSSVFFCFVIIFIFLIPFFFTALFKNSINYIFVQFILMLPISFFYILSETIFWTIVFVARLCFGGLMVLNHCCILLYIVGLILFSFLSYFLSNADFCWLGNVFYKWTWMKDVIEKQAVNGLFCHKCPNRLLWQVRTFLAVISNNLPI